jgi:predicted dehydrogenase
MSLRIGVIGASYAAATHLPAYAALAADGVAEVVAVATSRRETADAAARRFGVPTAHVGFEALCADPDVDLVDVVTRPSRHRPMAEAALAAGKHVLVEAPLAATVADGEALEAAADKANRSGVVDLQSRFWPGLAELHRLVHDGYLGRVQNIVATAFYPTFTQQVAVAASGWCADATTGASTACTPPTSSAGSSASWPTSGAPPRPGPKPGPAPTAPSPRPARTAPPTPR